MSEQESESLRVAREVCRSKWHGDREACDGCHEIARALRAYGRRYWNEALIQSAQLVEEDGWTIEEIPAAIRALKEGEE